MSSPSLFCKPAMTERLLMNQMEYHNILDIFNTAESVYSSMHRNGILATAPHTFRMELPLPQFMATAFAVISNGKALELEIHYATGEKETIRSPKY